MSIDQFDRTIYFDKIRPLFGGSMSQQQVDGQNFILDQWCDLPFGDLRWLAYSLATTYHETAQKMWPIEEYKGAEKPYGQVDPVTGQRYYGRGFVQLTHKDNYSKMTPVVQTFFPTEPVDLVNKPEQALIPLYASVIMFFGMNEGMFRPPNSYVKFFDEDTDDAYGAREIINGDKHVVPSWSNGVSVGNLIKGYHQKFMSALLASLTTIPEPEPVTQVVMVNIVTPPGVEVVVNISKGES